MGFDVDGGISWLSHAYLARVSKGVVMGVEGRNQMGRL